MEEDQSPDNVTALVPKQELTAVNPDASGVDSLIDYFEQLDQESDGKFLVRVPKQDGTTVSLMRYAERSFDKHPRLSFFGFDSGEFLVVTGPLAEEIDARASGQNLNAHRLIEPIEGTNFEELVANSKGILDGSGQDGAVNKISADQSEDVERMRKNYKLNILNTGIEMKAKQQALEIFNDAVEKVVAESLAQKSRAAVFKRALDHVKAVRGRPGASVSNSPSK